MTRLAAAFCVMLGASSAFAQASADVVSEIQARVAKLYGAGLGRAEGYGAGVLISADGRILTTYGAYLESPSARAVLADGRRFPLRLAAHDEKRGLALLEIDAAQLPHFELSAGPRVQQGDWLLVAANPFRVAVGSEPASVSIGVLAGSGELDARRRAQDFPYRGPVLWLDAITAVPGAAGGAVATTDGRLVGLVGQPVLRRATNTWANYAIPLDELAAFLDETERGTAAAQAPVAPAGIPIDLGLRMYDLTGPESPAFVERVTPGSAARRAGVLADDLILSLAGRSVQTCAEVQRAFADLPAAGVIELVVQRGERTFTIELRLEPQ